jgi:hypothetical protein
VCEVWVLCERNGVSTVICTEIQIDIYINKKKTPSIISGAHNTTNLAVSYFLYPIHTHIPDYSLFADVT